MVKIKSMAKSCLAVAACQMVSACTTTPSIDQFQHQWKPANAQWSGPAVQVLVNHITCQMIADYVRHDHEGSKWRLLSKYHFVAAINLNLSVTHSEGFNPSLSFVQPLTGGGQLIHPIIANAASGDTSGSFSRSLAVTGQLSGSQTNTVTYTYQIDMQQIAEAALASEGDAIIEKDDKIILDPETSSVDLKTAVNEERLVEQSKAVFEKFNDWCKGDNTRPAIQLLKGDLLQGDLAIAENIDEGLNALEALKLFNIYSSSGPSNPRDVGNLTTPVSAETVSAYKDDAQFRADARAQAKNGVILRPNVITEVLATGAVPAAKPAGSSPQGSGASPTSFASVVTFNISAGGGVGPNWTLLLFKGPSGGGAAGGGGSGSSAGAGGGSGGGSGGGGQLLNYSHTANDSFTVTFAPTCKTNTEYPVSITGFGDAVANSTDAAALTFTVSTTTEGAKDGQLIIVLPAASAAGTTTASGSILYPEAHASAPGIGTVSWTILRRADGAVNIFGTVVNPFNQAAVGSIVLGGTYDLARKTASISGYMSDDVFNKLVRSSRTDSYWDTINGCDVTASSYIQSVVANATQTSKDLTLQSKLAGN